MAEYAAKRNVKPCRTHPGELLRDDILAAKQRKPPAPRDGRLTVEES
jgi:hypothetical protein